jgi:hypothetical protein
VEKKRYMEIQEGMVVNRLQGKGKERRERQSTEVSGDH